MKTNDRLRILEDKVELLQDKLLSKLVFNFRCLNCGIVTLAIKFVVIYNSYFSKEKYRCVNCGKVFKECQIFKEDKL